MKKWLSKVAGFTLVELMVVVAIIGVLSAVAIPNFKTYQAKAKTSEAKLSLASIYTAEVTLMSDYDTYASCLTFAGYSAGGAGTGAGGAGGTNYFATGFTGEGQISTVTTNGGAGCATGQYQFGAGKKAGSAVAAVGDIPSGTPSASAFTAGAAGSIGAGSTTFSKWTITEKKALVNTVTGY